MDGTGGALRDLSRRYRLVIVTTRSRLVAEAFLARQGLDAQIQIVTGREDTQRIQPHPSPVQHTAQRLDMPVERCLVVGDTTADIRTARAAGTRSAGVLRGFGQREELVRAGAPRIVETTTQLAEWL